MNKLILKKLNQKPVAYYPVYRELTGSLSAGILLSQLMYWFSKKDKIYKTNLDFMDEIQLTEHEMKGAKQKIKNLDFIEITREGIPATTYYKIDWDLYESCLSNMSVGRKSPNKKSGKNSSSTVGRKSPNCTGGNHPTNSETTTETTNTSSKEEIRFDKSKPKKKTNISKLIKKIAKKENEKKFKTHKSLRSYKYTKQDRRFYRLLQEKYNVTGHDVTKSGYAHTMDMIHALFSNQTKSPLLVKEYKSKWFEKDFLEVLEYHIEHAVENNKRTGEKKKVNIGSFIFVDQKVNRHISKPYSLLINTLKEIERNKKPTTPMGIKVFNKLKYMYPAKNTGTQMYVYENAGKALTDIMTDHSMNTNSGYTSLLPFFVAYVKEKARSASFLMKYIGKDFLIQFKQDAIKKGVIKTKGKKGMYDKQW